MSKTLDVHRIVTGLTAAGIVAVLLGLGLHALATPDHAEARLAAVDSRLQALQRERNAGAETPASVPGAICPDAATGLTEVRAGLETAARKAAVTLLSSEVTYGGHSASPFLSPLNVEADLRGQEEPLDRFITELSTRAPVLLADTLDLSSNGEELTLHIKGKVLCHDHRLP